MEPTNPDPAAAAAAANEPEDQPMILDPDVNNYDDGDEDEDGPQFVTAGDDAIEVPVDDENVPMEDDDDDDNGHNITATAAEDADRWGPDQSQFQIRSHTDSVYTISVAPNLDNNTSDSNCSPARFLTIVSGGGDDRAFWHHVPIHHEEQSSSSSSSSTGTTSIQLAHAHTDSVSATAINWTCPQFNANTTPALIAVAGYDGAIVLYHLQREQQQQQQSPPPTLLEGPSDVEWLRFHPTGTVLLAGSATDGTVWMYHVGQQQQQQGAQSHCLQVFVGHESAVTAGDFTPNGKLVVTASADGTVRVWAPKTGMAKHVFRFVNNNNSAAAAAAGVTCLQVGGGSDGKLIMVGTEDGQAHLCHVGTKKVVASLRHSEVPLQQPPRMNNDDDDDDEEEEEELLAVSVEGVGFCPTNTNWCATAGVDGVLKIWDLTNHQCRQVCRHDEGGVTRLQWLSDQPVVVTTTTAGTVHLWDARSGMQIQQPLTTGSTATINDLQVLQQQHGGSTVIFTAGDDHVVRIFEVDVNQLLRQQRPE